MLMRNRPDPDHFEAFYKDVRGRLLLQTWALTGDLPAAQKAVRDALVIGWHHWRKISRLADPESYVRPLAWSRAQRRHSTRPFHREKGIADDVRATLASLGKLPLLQRKVLLLAHLTTLPLDQLAREVGITQARAERELQTATAAFSLHRGVPTTSILALFEPLAAELTDVRWPRPSILTRAGAARRRAHTAVGALAAVAALLGSGVAVSDTDGVRPRLQSMHLLTPETTGPPPAYPLTSERLLSDAQVAEAFPGSWTTDLTSDNTGDGMVMPCQQRFADRSRQASLLRTFTTDPTGNDPDGRTAAQATEIAVTPEAAHHAYAATLKWYAGCRDARVQLVSTRIVGGVGDEAAALVLRDWDEPVRAIVVGVARTGLATTTVASTVPASLPRPVPRTTRLLAQAVGKLCELPGGGACAGTPVTEEIPPFPVGAHPGLLTELDLPPVPGVPHPWEGTTPTPATTNVAATRCDSSVFHRKGVTGDLTRTFVIPEASGLPPQFGLTQTVGSFGTPKAAQRFVATVRDRLATCPQRDLGTDVQAVATPTGRLDATVWRVTVELTETRSVVFLMAIIRTGDNVAQLGFVPSGSATIAEADFVALTHRAAERLAFG